MTVKDAINLAEGFTQIANPDAIIVTQSFTGIDNSGNEIKIVEQVNDINLDYNVGTGATINVLPIENVVSVEGNVYNPGLITHSGRKSIKRYISLAGGMKKDSIISDIYVQRANGKIKRISRLNGLYLSLIHI